MCKSQRTVRFPFCSNTLTWFFFQMSEYGYGHGFRPYGNPMNPSADNHRPGRLKNLDEVVCFKCGENGHFANRCTKGHLAFLSANAGRNHRNNQQSWGKYIITWSWSFFSSLGRRQDFFSWKITTFLGERKTIWILAHFFKSLSSFFLFPKCLNFHA